MSHEFSYHCPKCEIDSDNINCFSPILTFCLKTRIDNDDIFIPSNIGIDRCI